MAKTKSSAPRKARVASADPIAAPTAAAFEHSIVGVDSGEVPRWVRNDPIRIGQVMQLGYEFAKDEDGEKVIVRDSILMKVPEDTYEARQEYKNNRARELASAGTNRFRDVARQTGAQVEDKTTTRRGTAADAED